MRSSTNFRIVFSESQNASPLDAELGPDFNGKWPFKSFKVIRFGVHEEPLKGYIVQYNSGLECESSENTASETSENRHLRPPHSHLTPPLQQTLANIHINLTLLETRFPGQHKTCFFTSMRGHAYILKHKSMLKVLPLCPVVMFCRKLKCKYQSTGKSRHSICRSHRTGICVVYHRLNGSSSPVLTATSFSYGSLCDFLTFFSGTRLGVRPPTDLHAKWFKWHGFTHTCAVYSKNRNFLQPLTPKTAKICLILVGT